jgi:hypothetical protein
MTLPAPTILPAFAGGVPQSAQQVLVDLYDDAASRIAEMIRTPTGKTFDARRFGRARAAELIGGIENIMRHTRRQTYDWLGPNVSRAYGRGLTDAVKQLKAIGLRGKDLPVQGGFSVIDRRTVATIAADMAVSLDSALSDQAKAAQRFLRAAAQKIAPDSEISKVIAKAAITGDIRAAVRNMRGLLNVGQIADYRKAGSQIVQIGGAQMTVRAYSEMLVRTRLREAVQHGRHERLVANGHDLVMVVGRISENFCTEYVGRVFSIRGITGESDEYPALDELPGGGPPFHPNCSKSTRPYIARFASDEQKTLARMRVPKSLLTTDAAEAQAAFDTTRGPDRARARLDKAA